MGPRMLIVAKGTLLGDFILRYYRNIIETFEEILKICNNTYLKSSSYYVKFSTNFFTKLPHFQIFLQVFKIILKKEVITTFKIFLNIFYSFRLFSNLYICSYGILWMILLYK